MQQAGGATKCGCSVQHHSDKAAAVLGHLLCLLCVCAVKEAARLRMALTIFSLTLADMSAAAKKEQQQGNGRVGTAAQVHSICPGLAINTNLV